METIKYIYTYVTNSKKSTNTLVYLFFILLSLFLLRSILFSHGLMIGEDSAPPLTNIQIKDWLDMGRFSWNFNNFVSYRNVFVGSAIIYQTFLYIVSLIGISGDIFIKLFLLFLFCFAGITMYKLLVFLKVERIIAILAGVFYITTPIFFNYTIMGWFFVLLILGTLPLAVRYFITAVTENNIEYAVITGIIFAVSFIQSQTLVWFPIVFLILAFYLISSKKSLVAYLRTVGIVFTLFILLNAHVLLNLLLPDKAISGSDYINATASLGMVINFYPLNIIRLWGGLYNYQYETIISKFNSPLLIFLSFLVPMLIIGTLFIKKNRKLIITFWLVGLVPFGLYLLKFHREWLTHIPFSNVIRDFARFSIFSALASTVLLAIFLSNFVFEKNIKYKKVQCTVFTLFILLWLVYLMPWWTGEISKWEHNTGVDSRLSTQIFSSEFFGVETELSKMKLDLKAIYLPPSFNDTVQYEDDPKYKDHVRDIFAMYSPIPGELTTTDRNLGPVQYIDLIQGSLGSNIMDIINSTNARFLIVRKDMISMVSESMNKVNKEKVLQNLEKEVVTGRLSKTFSGNKIDIYRKNIFLPHFYTPQTIITTPQSIDTLPDIVSQKNYKIRSAIYFNNPLATTSLITLIATSTVATTTKTATTLAATTSPATSTTTTLTATTTIKTAATKTATTSAATTSSATSTATTSSAIFNPKELKKSAVNNTPII